MNAVACDLPRVLELTESMHEAASESRWDDLAVLESERETVLQAAPIAQSPDSVEPLRSIMLLDTLITDLVSAARDEAAAAWDAHRRSRRAVAAYSAI